MYPLITPFGQVHLAIDGREIKYQARPGSKSEILFPDILGRYQIEIDFKPDGKKHIISCTLDGDNIESNDWESEENLECQAFYSKDKMKLSLGVCGEVWEYFKGELVYCNNDYDIDYLDQGMAYIIFEETKTDKYVFGISWIDGIDLPIKTEENLSRDNQTWSAADPNLRLK